jgi:hypothetical protein
LELKGYEDRVREIDETCATPPRPRSKSVDADPPSAVEVRTRYGGWKTELGQLGGKVEKLQFKGLDTVMTGGLTTGRDDARALRKSLNKRVAVLNAEIKRVHSEVGQQMFALLGDAAP